MSKDLKNIRLIAGGVIILALFLIVLDVAQVSGEGWTMLNSLSIIGLVLLVVSQMIIFVFLRPQR